MANGQIKINELPETAVVKGDDAFIVENGVITQKISLANLDKYINEHLPFGTTENTVYDGALGKAVSDSLALHTTSTANPHSVTKSQVGLSNVDNTSDMSKPVSTLQQTFIDSAYANSNAYTDQKIADLINGAPSTLDTLGKIANALQNNPGVSDALEEAIGSKADATELNSHIQNDTIHITASERLSFENKLGKNDDAGETTVSFSETSDLTGITSGEKMKTVMGKVAKAISAFINHLSTHASDELSGHVKLSDAYENALENGAAADGMGASQKALADAYSALNIQVSDSLGGLTFGMDADGNPGYIKAGADTVTPFKSGVEFVWGICGLSGSINLKNTGRVKLTVLEFVKQGNVGVYGTTSPTDLSHSGHAYGFFGTGPGVTNTEQVVETPDIETYPYIVLYAIYATGWSNNSSINTCKIST